MSSARRRQVTGLACAMLFVAASSDGLAGGEPGSRSADSLTVMSFNIRYGTAADGDNAWPHRREAVIEVIEAFRVDVLGVQEALHFQLEELAAALPRYERVGVGRDDGAAAGEYAAILFDGSRLELLDQGTFWFSDTPEQPGSTSWGNDIPRICTWARLREFDTGDSFYVFNVHWDHRSQPSRERAAELLIERIEQHAAQSVGPDAGRSSDGVSDRSPAGGAGEFSAGAAGQRSGDGAGRLSGDGAGHLSDGSAGTPLQPAAFEPVLVTGDFNAGEDNPAFRYLLESAGAERLGLADTFRALHPEAGQVGTFNGFTGETGGDKIDAVLASAHWRVLGAEIVRSRRQGRYPSDHFPVVATLILR